MLHRAFMDAAHPIMDAETLNPKIHDIPPPEAHLPTNPASFSGLSFYFWIFYPTGSLFPYSIFGSSILPVASFFGHRQSAARPPNTTTPPEFLGDKLPLFMTRLVRAPAS